VGVWLPVFASLVSCLSSSSRPRSARVLERVTAVSHGKPLRLTCQLPALPSHGAFAACVRSSRSPLLILPLTLYYCTRTRDLHACTPIFLHRSFAASQPLSLPIALLPAQASSTARLLPTQLQASQSAHLPLPTHWPALSREQPAVQP